MSKSKIGFSGLVAASVLMLAFTAGNASAAGAARAAAAHKSNNVVSRTTQRTRTDNGYTVHSTATNAQGQTATRDATVVRDRAAGTATRTASWTNFEGGQGSSTSTRTRTDNGSVTATTVNHANGSTTERTATRVCDKSAKSCTTTIERSHN